MINHARIPCRQPCRRLPALAADLAGNVLPMAAVAMIVIATLIGGGIDMGRAYLVQNRLQAACDAAVLAGRRAETTGGFDATALDQANVYFNTNFDSAAMGARETAFSASASDSGNTIDATASAKIDTTVTRIVGFREFSLSASCQSTMGVGNSDITMVIDTTGSMDSTLSGTTQTRIQALRAEMKSFYTTLQTATTGSSARIRYAFVPYSSSVNVGQLIYNINPAYLADAMTIQSRQAVFVTEDRQIFDHWGSPVASTGGPQTGNQSTDDWELYSNTRYNSRDSCNANLPASSAWTNDGAARTDTSTFTNSSGQQVVRTTVTQRQQRTAYSCFRSGDYRYIYSRIEYQDISTWSDQTSDPVYRTETSTRFDHWDYKPVVYDTSTYKTFAATSTQTGNSGTAVSSTWQGCIEERSTTAAAAFSYSSILGVSPSAADLDIDSAPTSSASSKWAPMWADVSYYRTDSNGYASYASPTRYGGTFGVYCPRAARLLTTMTQTDFNAYADALTATGATYHDIGMAWGARLSSPEGIFAANVTDAPSNGGNVARHIIFMTDGQMDTSEYIHSSWGLEYYDRRVTADGRTDADARHTSRFLALCEATKAKGIRIWVIAFATSLTTDLQTCASSASAYTASNATQLGSAFQDIARQVGELRVVQ